MGKDSGQADITVTLSPSPGNSLGAEMGQTHPGAHYPSLNDSPAPGGGLCPPGAGSGGARPTPAAWESQGPAWEVNRWRREMGEMQGGPRRVAARATGVLSGES